MITLQPREQKVVELPEPVQNFTLVNETIARIDLEAEVGDGVLIVKVTGLYLGKSAEAPSEGGKKVWRLG